MLKCVSKALTHSNTDSHSHARMHRHAHTRVDRHLLILFPFAFKIDKDKKKA